MIWDVDVCYCSHVALQVQRTVGFISKTVLIHIVLVMILKGTLGLITEKLQGLWWK